uniref:Coiled-coil domain containing 198 n=1 Tax=Salvator merianae TaxID=96440 RepID=A0A8D0BKQ1_SALMN
MGLHSSKVRRKVTKVAPMPSKEERLLSSSNVAVYTFPRAQQDVNPSAFTSQIERNSVLERRLPPLRETCHVRYPTVLGPDPLDLTAEAEEDNLIKQHPPRKLQKLEPFILAKDQRVDKFSSLPTGSAASKAKERVKGNQCVAHPVGSRQYLLKMKMLEMRKEAELKRCLQQEARLNKTKARDFSLRGTHGCLQANNSSDEDLFSPEQDHTFNRDRGALWSGGFFNEHGPPDPHLGWQGKVQTWLLKQQARESPWDASSTDSDSWKEYDFQKPWRRPPLVRTKTERISLFDDFFDREF